MSFIYQDLRDRERTCIKEKVKSRSKYTCSEISYDPVEMTGQEIGELIPFPVSIIPFPVFKTSFGLVGKSYD